MRDRLWNELTQVKHNVEFITLYSDLQRKYIKWFNISILIFSAGGIMGWKIWDSFPLVACIIISFISLVRLIQPHLIMSEKQITILDQIHTFYFNYYNQLERLWYEYEDNRINNNTATNKFFELKEKEIEINIKVSDTIRIKPKKLIKKAKHYSDQYFASVYNIN